MPLITTRGGVSALAFGMFSSAQRAPVTNTYTSADNTTPRTALNGIERVPVGASQVVITVDGGGGGGRSYAPTYTPLGGGGGGRTVLTIAIASGDSGVSIPYTLGYGGNYDDGNTPAGTTINGGASSVTGTVAAGSISLSANGGISGRTTGVGGAASGGDTNTSGANGTSVNGGNGGSGAIGGNNTQFPAGVPGAGGGPGSSDAPDPDWLSTAGGNARIQFQWT